MTLASSGPLSSLRTALRPHIPSQRVHLEASATSLNQLLDRNCIAVLILSFTLQLPADTLRPHLFRGSSQHSPKARTCMSLDSSSDIQYHRDVSIGQNVHPSKRRHVNFDWPFSEQSNHSVTFISRVTMFALPFLYGQPFGPMSSTLIVCFPASQPVSQNASAVSRHCMSSSSTM